MTPRKSPNYEYAVLQRGMLPLAPVPGGGAGWEHRATAVLVWPGSDRPRPETAVLTDPCFTVAGLEEARQRLGRWRLSISELRYCFVTHLHHDHLPDVPGLREDLMLHPLPAGAPGPFEGMYTVSCPGHAPGLEALAFLDVGGRSVWIVGDAVLNLDWLREWRYYWPNGYTREEIVATWRSVALIVSRADVVVPGHGEPFVVTPELREELRRGFSRAEYAEDCPDVARVLVESERAG